MVNADLLNHAVIVPFDAIWHHSPYGNLLQACTHTAHEALRSVLPLDAQGCFAWHNADPVAADAESDRIISLVEGTGVVIRFV